MHDKNFYNVWYLWYTIRICYHTSELIDFYCFAAFADTLVRKESKRDVMAFLDSVSPEAEAIGAVNCIRRTLSLPALCPDRSGSLPHPPDP